MEQGCPPRFMQTWLCTVCATTSGLLQVVLCSKVPIVQQHSLSRRHTAAVYFHKAPIHPMWAVLCCLASAACATVAHGTALRMARQCNSTGSPGPGLAAAWHTTHHPARRNQLSRHTCTSQWPLLAAHEAYCTAAGLNSARHICNVQRQKRLSALLI
jgi:hypothetical protein